MPTSFGVLFFWLAPGVLGTSAVISGLPGEQGVPIGVLQAQETNSMALKLRCQVQMCCDVCIHGALSCFSVLSVPLPDVHTQV